MEDYRTYSIGRSRYCDIVIADNTVSRSHAELVITARGQHYITDCGSTSGTYLARGGDWEKVSQCFVETGEALLLGKHKTTLDALLTRLNYDSSATSDKVSHGPKKIFEKEDKNDLPSGKVKRDPLTGDIIGMTER